MVFGSRGLAFRIIIVILIGTGIGSLLPEIGTIAGFHMGIWPHIFNSVFLILGGICIGVAFYLGYRKRSI
jgi:hypothetical protein